MKNGFERQITEDSESKCMNGYGEWLWTPKTKEKNGDDCGCGYESTTSSITPRMTNGSKRLNANVALNAKLERGGGSEQRNWK